MGKEEGWGEGKRERELLGATLEVGGPGSGREERWAHASLRGSETSGGSLSLLQILRQYGINLSEEEFFHILEYYDKTLSSKISYNDFLHAFLQ